MAAARAGVEVSDHKELDVGVGENDGSDVPPLSNHTTSARLSSSHASLEGDKGFPDRTERGSAAGISGGLGRPDAVGNIAPVKGHVHTIRAGRQINRQVRDEVSGSRFGKREAPLAEGEPDSTVHRTRVEVEPPQPFGYAPRSGLSPKRE